MKEKERIYGYARVSTVKQKIERQVENIKASRPDAIIITEAYTGTKISRPQFDKLMERVRKDRAAGRPVTIVFDEVSRMSRNAEEGFALYKEMYDLGVNLEFIKEPHINTATYNEAIKRAEESAVKVETGDSAMDRLTASILDALKVFQMDLAKRQIELAFETAQAEVDFLHKRTSEGVRRAQAEGKQVGRKPDSKVVTSKEKAAREVILKHSRDFGGTLADSDVIKLAGISRNSYYKYKAALKAEIIA